MSRPTVAKRALERGVLWALAAFTAVAVGGYWNFVIHPERLPVTPLATRIYGVSFGLFARLHIVLALATLGILLVGRLRARWVPALLAVSGLAFLLEHVGTGTGVPFGGYGYSALLGPKVGGRVPLLIPVSWFLMALPSWVVARAWIPNRALRIAVGAAWLVAWDLALDPAMSYLTPYWRWEHPGAYYGMPWVNLLGWYAAGLLLVGVLDASGGRLGLDRLPVRWLAAYYLVVLFMPLGMIAAAGLTGAVLATLGGLVACGLATFLCARVGSAAAPTASTRPDERGRAAGPAVRGAVPSEPSALAGRTP